MIVIWILRGENNLLFSWKSHDYVFREIYFGRLKLWIVDDLFLDVIFIRHLYTSNISMNMMYINILLLSYMLTLLCARL